MSGGEGYVRVLELVQEAARGDDKVGGVVAAHDGALARQDALQQRARAGVVLVRKADGVDGAARRIRVHQHMGIACQEVDELVVNLDHYTHSDGRRQGRME